MKTQVRFKPSVETTYAYVSALSRVACVMHVNNFGASGISKGAELKQETAKKES